MINVLVVDDSAFMRKVLPDLINSDPELKVCGTARDGKDAIKKAEELKPDVITMDIEMPVMDGIEATKQIMSRKPTPILAISALTYEGSQYTIDAIDAGAVDFILKPDGSISLKIEQVKDEILKKIKAAAHAKLEIKKRPVKPISMQFKQQTYRKIVVIGSSTGGPQTLEQVVPFIPKNIPAPILIVQHMPPLFTASLAKRLDSQSEIRIVEAEEGQEIEDGKAYLAPGDFHMEVEQRKEGGITKHFIKLNQNEKEQGVRPSVNVTLRCVADVFGKNAVAVILTGMGSDGTEGSRMIKENGGKVIAQDKDTSIIYGMPKAVYDAGYTDSVCALEDIPVEILNILDQI